MMESPTRAQLPEGSIINAEIVVTSYFDQEGKLKYCANVDGNPNLAQAIGLLELGKVLLYSHYKANEPYEPDNPEEE
jgi:hypothetical protein